MGSINLKVETASIIKWLRTAILAGIGGGVVSAASAAFDPTKFHFPQDIGSGKLWIHFATGFAVMFGGLLIKSPLGQEVIASYKEAEQLLENSKTNIDEAKKIIATPQPETPPQTKE